MTPQAFAGIALSGIALAVFLLPSQKHHVCPWLLEDAILKTRLPRGWTNGMRKLSEWLDCDGKGDVVLSTGGVKVHRTEKYLNGLESPALYFRVDLQKGDGEKLGLGMTPKSDHVEVEKLSGAGAIARWNEDNPQLVVDAKDRIIIVNGIEGNGTVMADKLRSEVNLSLRVLRISEHDVQAAAARKLDKEITRVARVKLQGLGDGIPEPSGSHVEVLHAGNFLKFMELQPVAIVMFYANWCGHCKQSAPAYTRAAELLALERLSISTRIAKIDDADPMNRELRLGDMYNFTSYPTVIAFKNGKKLWHVPLGEPEEIVAVARSAALDLDPEKEVSKTLQQLKPMLYKKDVPSEVVWDLELDNFDDIVLSEREGNNAVWVIEFYSDQCPFCQSLKPEFVKASKKLEEKFKGQVRLGAVNSRAFGDIAKRFGVTSYPWVIAVYANRKVEDMAGLGGWESVFDWGVKMHQQVWKKEPTWSMAPILVPAETGESHSPADSKEVGMFSNSTGSWRELLGRRTWFFLHTVAAKYPLQPTEKDKEGIRHMISGLGQLYPCPICRLHLQKTLADPELGRVPVDHREDLAQWMCKLHNLVNDDLGKPQQPCSPFQLDLQYLKSCGECSANSSELPDADKEAAAAFDVSKYFEGALPKPKVMKR